MPNGLSPERLTLRQADQARDDFAQIIDELDFVKELLARLPTRRDQAFTPLRIRLGSAVLSAGSLFCGSRHSGAIASDSRDPHEQVRSVSLAFVGRAHPHLVGCCAGGSSFERSQV